MSFELTHLRLLVEDYASCFYFYKSVLGLAVHWGNANSGYAEFEAGGVLLAVFGRSAMASVVGASGLPANPEAQDRSMIIFRVKNVDATCSKLKEHGVALVTTPEDRPEWGIRTAHFRDPGGNLVEINQRLA